MENQQQKKIKNPIVWVDLEMTGLDIENGDQIMELAVLVTDGDLNETYEGPEIVIKIEKQVLDNMNEWCVNQHGKSGLTQKCLESNTTIQQAEEEVMKFLQKLNIEKMEAVLGGNSVYMDRLFMRKYTRTFDQHLHYRIVDVSTLKELYKRWYPGQDSFKKGLSHRALDDIKESIAELKFYQEKIFKK